MRMEEEYWEGLRLVIHEYWGHMLGAALGLLIIWMIFPIRKKLAKNCGAVREFVAPTKGPRFRKRDKLAFVSWKVMRNAKGVASYIRGGRGQKRKAIAKFARRMMMIRNDSPKEGSRRPQLPEAFLEVDELRDKESLPQELVFVLKNMRVFGHFSQFLFLELLKEIQTIRVSQNQYLFQTQDLDTNMYIVQSGTINVLNVLRENERDGLKSVILKTVKQGEPIVSLLSFLDYLSTNSVDRHYETIAAKAVEDSTVIKLSFQTFKNAFRDHPEHLPRVIQIIMLRLQRVTLLALNQYLGLGAELINEKDRGGDDNGSVSDLESLELRQFARQSFAKALGVDFSQVIPESIEIIDFCSGSVVVEENASKEVYLILVLEGCFVVSQKIDGVSKALHKAYQGGLLCQLQVLTGEPSLFTVTAAIKSTVAVMHSRDVHQIFSVQPRVSLNLALSVVAHLSLYVRSIDFALEWTLVESGKALYKQEDIADCIYVVLSGRLRSIISRFGKKELVAEYGRGELTGIVETLTNSRRSTTVMAIRDTEVAKLPSGLINSIKLRYPMVLLRLINLLGKKLQRTWESGNRCSSLSSLDDDSSSFSTVALIAITPGVPLSAFTYELCHAVNFIGPTIRLTADIIRRELGSTALDKTEDFKLSNWLAQQEDQHKLVLYQCDKDLTPWSQLCIRHADVILLIANPHSCVSEGVSSFEERIEFLSQRTRKELVFLHPESVEYPEGTSKWLRNRAWVNSYTHIRCAPRLFFKKKEIRVDDYYSKIFLRKMPQDVFSDFSRLARMLTGTSVGLVLGGGGARGCAHVGMIKAAIESNIPIDRVAGVSIGAFVGALYCQERELSKFIVKARSFAEKINCWWRQVLDLTYPFTAMFTGKAFNSQIYDVFKDREIEDLWLPFFTVTTDITDSSMRVHDYGSLWRYVRSSMSLAGYLPPLCDPHDGHLLLDGGYTNNLPADIMRSRGALHILAIDVGAQDETNMTNYGDQLSGWEVLWRKWNPFMSSLKVPDHTDIQSRLTYVSCARQLECVKKSDYCDYIRPPIDKFKTLQFGSFEVIKDVGYYHGKTYFLGLSKAGRMQQFQASLTEKGNDESSRRGSANIPIDISPNEVTFFRRASLSLQDCDFSSCQGLINSDLISSETNDDEEEELLSENEEDIASGFLS